MINFLKYISIFITAAIIISCSSDSNLVYIYSNTDNQSTAYFQPAKIGTKIKVLSTQTKNVIGYFERKKPGEKTFIIRQDNGDFLYFIESAKKKSIIHIFDINGFIWGYFYQY